MVWYWRRRLERLKSNIYLLLGRYAERLRVGWLGINPESLYCSSNDIRRLCSLSNVRDILLIIFIIDLVSEFIITIHQYGNIVNCIRVWFWELKQQWQWQCSIWWKRLQLPTLGYRRHSRSRLPCHCHNMHTRIFHPPTDTPA